MLRYLLRQTEKQAGVVFTSWLPDLRLRFNSHKSSSISEIVLVKPPNTAYLLAFLQDFHRINFL